MVVFKVERVGKLRKQKMSSIRFDAAWFTFATSLIAASNDSITHDSIPHIDSLRTLASLF